MFHELGGGGIDNTGGKGGSGQRAGEGGLHQQAANELSSRREVQPPKAGGDTTVAKAGSDTTPETRLAANSTEVAQVVPSVQAKVGAQINGLSTVEGQQFARAGVNDAASFYASGEYASMVARMT